MAPFYDVQNSPLPDNSSQVLYTLVSNKIETFSRQLILDQDSIDPIKSSANDEMSENVKKITEKLSGDLLLAYMMVMVDIFDMVSNPKLACLKVTPVERFLEYSYALAELILENPAKILRKNGKINSIHDLCEALYGDRTTWPWWPNVGMNGSIDSMVVLFACRDGLTNLSLKSLSEIYDLA